MRSGEVAVEPGLRDKTSPVPGLGYLLPNKHVRQRAVDASQRSITDAGKAAEQAQIKPAFAAVPAVIAGRGSGLQNRRQPLSRKRAKIVAAKRRAGLAEEFDTAERAATQRIDGGGPALLDAFDGVLDIGFEARVIHPAEPGRGNPRQTDAGRAVAPLARPR